MADFDPAKLKALDAALAIVKQEVGEENVHMGTDVAQSVEVIPTGCLPLDIALGVGGVPRGRIVEIFGPEASGKTTFALSVIAQAQKKGEICAFVDVEQALDPTYARNLGVDFDHMPLIQPENGEKAMEAIEILVRSKAVSVIVLDSVAALVLQSEIDGEMGDAHVAGQARLMSQAMRKLVNAVKRSNCILIFTNQLRDKIGGMGGYGPTQVTSGGNALKYYASVRLDIRRIKTEKDAKTGGAKANRVRVKVVKNKVAPPYKEAEMLIYYGSGFDRAAALIEIGVEIKAVKKSGAYFAYGEQTMGQGLEKAREFLTQNPDIADEIEAKILAEKLVLAKPADKPASDSSLGDDSSGD